MKKIQKIVTDWWKDPLLLRKWEVPYLRRKREEGQVSAPVVSNSRGVFQYYGKSSMFIEDMYTGISPFMMYKGNREKFPIKVEPDSSEVRRILRDGIARREYPSSLEDAVHEFVRNVAHSLFQSGVAMFEIVSKKNETGETISFDFVRLESRSVIRIFNTYYQLVLWPTARREHMRVQLNRIPAAKVIKISLPASLGSPRKHLRMLKRMWWLSKEVVPDFQLKAMQQNENIGLDAKEYMRREFVELAQLSKDFGWGQRSRSHDYITEHYSMILYLRHKRTEAVVRDSILLALNKALNGPELNLNVSISLQNLPTLAVIEEKEALLEKGDVAFSDIFNALNF